MSINTLANRKTTKPASVKPATACFISEDGSSVTIVSGSKAKRLAKEHKVEAVRYIVTRTK